MASIFSVPPNMPKGTAVSDGYRIAPNVNFKVNPATTNIFTQTVNGVTSTTLSGAGYSRYGKGMLQTPLCTYNITPAPSTNGNIVATINAGAGGWLTLFGDGVATTIVNAGQSANPSTGFPGASDVIFPANAPSSQYLQLDWPRVPYVTLAGAAITGAGLNVTFFGHDYYGFPMQSTYNITAIGTYPNGVINQSGPGPLQLNSKAFYQITAVYLSGNLPANATLTCQTSNTFGLPYALTDDASVFQFDWGTVPHDMINQSGLIDLAAGVGTIINPAAAVGVQLSFSNPTPITVNRQPSIAFGTITPRGTQGFLSVGTILPSKPSGAGRFVLNSSSNADASRVSWQMPNAGLFLTQAADTSNATATTGDVRGLVQLPNTLEQWDNVPDGNTNLIFSYYVSGFDQNLNLLAAGKQPQGAGTVPYNDIYSIYGQTQFYSGVPAA